MKKPTPDPINDPEYWYRRSREARMIAEQIDDPKAWAMMWKIAKDYQILAERAKQRALKNPLKSN